VYTINANDEFKSKLSHDVKTWGVEVIDLQIENTDCTDVKLMEAIGQTGVNNLIAATNLRNAGANAKARVIEAQGKRDAKIEEGRGEAGKIELIAEAQVKAAAATEEAAAKLTSSNAFMLTVLNKLRAIAGESNNTFMMPTGLDGAMFSNIFAAASAGKTLPQQVAKDVITAQNII